METRIPHPKICMPTYFSSEMGRSTSGNLIADVIEKTNKPGGPVRVYADNKVSFRELKAVKDT